MPRPEPQQAILVAAVTGQTRHQHAMAGQAVSKADKKRKAACAKVTALAQVSPRLPLRSLKAEPIEPLQLASKAVPQYGAAQPHWLLQNMVVGASQHSLAVDAPVVVSSFSSIQRVFTWATAEFGLS